MKSSSIALLVVSALFATPITCLPSADSCSAAYGNVQDTESLARCRSDAEAGKAVAQFGYGLILFNGRDRKHDRPLAVDWFRKSAKQGYVLAQVALGRFLNHEELPALRNRPEAYAWYSVAGETEAADKLRSELSGQEAEEAERLAKQYVQKYPKRLAP